MHGVISLPDAMSYDKLFQFNPVDNMLNQDVLQSLNIVFILANNANPDDLWHFIWDFTVYQSFQYTKSYWGRQ